MVWAGLLAEPMFEVGVAVRVHQLAQWTRQGLSFLAREFNKGLRASGVPRTDQGNNPSGNWKALAVYNLWGERQKKLVGNVQLR